MKIDTQRLITVKNYADLKSVTTTAVYGWIASGKEKSVKIDGVTFVLLGDEDAKEYEEKKNTIC